jgi:hypothetical protein
MLLGYVMEKFERTGEMHIEFLRFALTRSIFHIPYSTRQTDFSSRTSYHCLLLQLKQKNLQIGLRKEQSCFTTAAATAREVFVEFNNKIQKYFKHVVYKLLF